MTDIEKLKEYTTQIDILIKKRVNPKSEEFTLWKTKTERILGKIFGNNSKEYTDFCKTRFTPSLIPLSANLDTESIKYCCDELPRVRAILRAYLDELEEGCSQGSDGSKLGTEDLKESFKMVFIVHGHDGELKNSVARLLEKQGIEPIILNEKVNKGQTIIEKIEEYSQSISAAICLFTADDKMADGSKRARQNVVFETGYFYGKVGRDKTIIVAENETLNLSDLQGIVYVNKNNWEVDVLKELREIGYKIDLNRL